MFFLRRYFLSSSTPRSKTAKGTESSIYLSSMGAVLKIRLAKGFHIMRARIKSSLILGEPAGFEQSH